MQQKLSFKQRNKNLYHVCKVDRAYFGEGFVVLFNTDGSKRNDLMCVAK